MLREYREKLGISQERLESITNLDRKTIFRLENDINIPKLDTFAKVVIALNLSDKEIAKEVKMVAKKETEK